MNIDKKYELTEAEKQAIVAFMGNEQMREAVKKHLLMSISKRNNIEELQSHWVYTLDRSWDDAKYGNFVKMVAQAHAELEDAFSRLQDVVDDSKKSEEVPTETYA